MGELVQGRSKYSDEDRRRAVVEYCVSGLMSKVSECTDIPETTLSSWKNKSDWWDDQVAAVRSEIGERITAQNMEIATRANELVLDSIKNGDEKLVWDKKKEKHVIKRVKMNGKEASVTSGIAQDKARRDMGLPTHIHAQSADAQIRTFIDEFRVTAQSFNEKQVKVVSTQGSDDEPDD